MIQLTPQMRILVSIEPADFRRGIDGLAKVCRAELSKDPFSGTVFVFRNRRKTGVKILVYDGQGFWLCYKRLSKEKYRYWPTHSDNKSTQLRSHELLVLLSGGDPLLTNSVPEWRPVDGKQFVFDSPKQDESSDI